METNDREQLPKIPKSFWRENLLEEESFAEYIYLVMKLLDSDDDIGKKIVEEVFKEPNMEDIEHKEYLSRIYTPEDMIKFVRHPWSLSNIPFILQKAEQMEKDLIPLILKRYQTSTQSVFIENAVQILDKCDIIYIRQLKDMFSNIRSPYARSLACLVFAARKEYDTIPLIMDEYQKMLEYDYDDCDGEYLSNDEEEHEPVDYEDGPLLALYLLYDKF